MSKQNNTLFILTIKGESPKHYGSLSVLFGMNKNLGVSLSTLYKVDFKKGIYQNKFCTIEKSFFVRSNVRSMKKKADKPVLPKKSIIEKSLFVDREDW